MNIKKLRNGWRLMELLAVVAMVAVCMAVMPARGDQGVQDFGITNKIAAAVATTANSGSTNGLRIDKQDACGIQFSGQGDASGTGNLIIPFQISADGSNWTSKFPIVFTIPLNGTTAVTYYTNIPNTILGAAGWIRVGGYLTNADGTANATNCLLWLSKKTVKPSP